MPFKSSNIMKYRAFLMDTIYLFTSILLVMSINSATSQEAIPLVPSPRGGWPLPSFNPVSSPPPKYYHHDVTPNTRLDTSAELVLGTFSQEVEDAWFYETYYPIVLKLEIPDWSPDGLRLNRSAPQCDTDDKLFNFLCPSQQHLDSILTRLSHSTRFFKNIYTASLFSSDEDDHIFDEDPSCSKIKSHFFHFSTTLKGMDTYLDELRQKCPLAKDLKMIEKSVSTTNIHQGAVRHAYERFTQQHNKNHPENNPSQTADATNKNATREISAWEFAQMAGYTTFQNTFTLFTYADSVRWANAFTTCQANRLDINLIPPQLLMTILDEASRNLTRLELGYNISLPLDSMLTHFYKLPLVDCILALEGMSDAFLMLRLLVPVTKYYKHYKLMKLSKVPFFIRNTEHEHKEAGSICEIKNYLYDEMFVVEYDTSMRGDSMPVITSVMKAPPTCGPYHVCKIPETVHRNLVDACVEGIVSGNEDLTKNECGFKCYPVSKQQIEDDFPYVIQLTSNRFAVVGAMINETKGATVSIKCYGRTRLAALKQEKMDEATIITLNCGCSIHVRDVTYFPEYPCNTSLEVIHVTHVVEDGYNGFKLFEGGQKTKLIQDTMNESKGNKNRYETTENSGKNKVVLPEEEEPEVTSGEKQPAEEEYTVDDELMFSIPYADNRNAESVNGAGNNSPLVLVVLDASQGEGYEGTHIVIWVIGSILMISNLAVLYLLYKNGLVTLDGVLFMK